MLQLNPNPSKELTHKNTNIKILTKSCEFRELIKSSNCHNGRALVGREATRGEGGQVEP